VTTESSLIGYTGFIGSNLKAQHDFTECYNRANIQTIRGKQFDTVVCAGVQAVKWWANQHPEEDRRQIHVLSQALEQVKARSFVLISTVDIYPNPIAVDETVTCRALPNHAYGSNRLEFEAFIFAHFPNATIIRLPAMFGPGLKKNVNFDLLHNNNLAAIDPNAEFQYYSTAWLWKDIQTALEKGLRLVNFATEPLRTNDIAAACFPEAVLTGKPGTPARYDMRSLHASSFGAAGPYLYSAQQVMDELGQFVHGKQREVAA
jgi:nucleoside-diphosphate-sugar epimerase